MKSYVAKLHSLDNQQSKYPSLTFLSKVFEVNWVLNLIQFFKWCDWVESDLRLWIPACMERADEHLSIESSFVIETHEFVEIESSSHLIHYSWLKLRKGKNKFKSCYLVEFAIWNCDTVMLFFRIELL